MSQTNPGIWDRLRKYVDPSVKITSGADVVYDTTPPEPGPVSPTVDFRSRTKRGEIKQDIIDRPDIKITRGAADYITLPGKALGDAIPEKKLKVINDRLDTVSDKIGLKSLAEGKLPGSRTFSGRGKNTGRAFIFEKIKESPWIGRIASAPAAAAAATSASLLPESWDKIVRGRGNVWAQQFLDSVAFILTDWWEDPKTLCCLIKNLGAISDSIGKGLKVARVNSQYNFFNELIALIDLIIAFLEIRYGKGLTFDLDIANLLSTAMIGAMIALLQSRLNDLRNKNIRDIKKILEKNINGALLKCLPLTNLIDFIIKFLYSDQGLFALFKRYIRDYLNSLQLIFNQKLNKAMAANMKDIDQLKRLRIFLVNLRDAMINFEMCIEDTTQQGIESDSIRRQGIGDARSTLSQSKQLTEGDESTGDSGTSRGRQGVSFPTDNEVFNFLTKRMGYSQERANQVVTFGKSTSQVGGNTGGDGDRPVSNPLTQIGEFAQGTIYEDLSATLGDCARTLDSETIEELAKHFSRFYENA